MQRNQEFLSEQKHLYETKQYMEHILQQSKSEIDAADDKIREAMQNIDYLDSSDSFMNILTNSRFYELARTQKEGLEAVKNKPYFARIHFQRPNEAEEHLYIGKTSLFDSESNEPIIVDWRSPVANVYYDGRLGDLTYKVREEDHHGHLFAKRQYKIEKGELLEYRDVDLTTTDELLQDALAGKADVRLTEIVSTIQKEQNEIIRAHLKQPILVQGAAGSGKTTIALHRISYFLYTMGTHFNPEKLMILAPSNLFIEYIGDVLPELGVDRICQTTFDEYVQNATQTKCKVVTQTTLLEQLLDKNKAPSPLYIEILRKKGELLYKDVLDRIINREIEKTSQLFEDVLLEKYRIIKGSHLKKLFLVEFAYLPIEKRLDRIKNVIQTEIKRKSKLVLHSLKSRYDEAIERALNGMRDAEKRKRVVTKYLDERDERIPKIQLEAKTLGKRYMQRFSKIKVKQLYRDFVTSRSQIQQLIPEFTLEEEILFLEMHKKDLWTSEDLAALLYLHSRIKGIEDKWKMHVVFIDEVQDFSIIQLAALKDALETDMFTMVGDLAQGIHQYKSLTNWTPVLELFPRATYSTLQKSYRTTIEIMELANTLLQSMDESLPLVEPVVRHGNQPSLLITPMFNIDAILHVYRKFATKHSSIALITKTNDEAIFIEKALASHLHVQLLQPQSSLEKEIDLLIVPSHLAKGLEFDAVIVCNVDQIYTSDVIDQKLLYVAFTRAMHELTLIGPSAESFMLTKQHLQIEYF